MPVSWITGHTETNRPVIDCSLFSVLEINATNAHCGAYTTPIHTMLGISGVIGLKKLLILLIRISTNHD